MQLQKPGTACFQHFMMTGCPIALHIWLDYQPMASSHKDEVCETLKSDIFQASTCCTQGCAAGQRCAEVRLSDLTHVDV
jgi:hypothetical protein